MWCTYSENTFKVRTVPVVVLECICASAYFVVFGIAGLDEFLTELSTYNKGARCLDMYGVVHAYLLYGY